MKISKHIEKKKKVFLLTGSRPVGWTRILENASRGRSLHPSAKEVSPGIAGGFSKRDGGRKAPWRKNPKLPQQDFFVSSVNDWAPTII